MLADCGKWFFLPCKGHGAEEIALKTPFISPQFDRILIHIVSNENCGMGATKIEICGEGVNRNLDDKDWGRLKEIKFWVKGWIEIWTTKTGEGGGG